jgi:hypothetical protein
MSGSNNSVSTDNSRDSNGASVLVGVQQQINTITGGASITEIQQNVIAVASEKVTGVKEAVVENIMPPAGEALQSAQKSIYTLAGKVATGSDSQGEKGMFLPCTSLVILYPLLIQTRVWLERVSPQPDHQLIDQMDEEKICDFLRDKHRSTAPPPSKN